MNDRKCFIGVAGNIGAGKSTLTQLLAESFNWQPFYEANTENPYLADFYQDMRQWSFHSQVFFLGKRLEHHRQLLDHPRTAIQDRTVYEDAEIFARNLYQQGHMSDRDYDAYRSLYQAVSAFLPPPDLIIYLKSSVETLQNRIHQRGRDYERNISNDYLSQLNGLYDSWIGDWRVSQVLCVNMDEMDFRQNAADLDWIKAQVEGMLTLPIPKAK